MEADRSQRVLHLALHVVVPGLVAALGYGPAWRQAWLVMMATMAVDLDHLLATPVYDPDRCSLGFHPPHTAPAIALHALLALPQRTRLIGVGLLLHMALDGLDCVPGV
jgi:hypothetical protein